jgi:hypothetical protein
LQNARASVCSTGRRGRFPIFRSRLQAGLRTGEILSVIVAIVIRPGRLLGIGRLFGGAVLRIADCRSHATDDDPAREKNRSKKGQSPRLSRLTRRRSIETILPARVAKTSIATSLSPAIPLPGRLVFRRTKRSQHDHEIYFGGYRVRLDIFETKMDAGRPQRSARAGSCPHME